MRNIIIKIAPYLVIGCLIFYIFKTKDKKEIIEVLRSDTLELVSIDTVYTDSVTEIIKVVKVVNPINQSLLESYKKALQDNDSLRQLELYKDAITERKYFKTYENDLQKISVQTNVVGTLKTQDIKYQFKEDNRFHYYVGGSLSNFKEPTVGINFGVLHKSRIYELGIDNKKVVTLGVKVKLR